jgi:Xaa-Pro aminopeptidase
MRRLLIVLTLALLPGALRAQFTEREYQERRQALAARVPDGVILAIGSPEPAEDYMSFYQNASFNYLTGFLEPDAALVMVKRGSEVTSTMFVQPRDPAAETWTGARLGIEGVRQRTGMQARPSGELISVLDSLAASGLPLMVIGQVSRDMSGAPGHVASPDEQLVAALRRRHPSLDVQPINEMVMMLRGTKSPTEQAMIRKAVDITVLALQEAMRALEPGMNEYELQALIEYTFRRNGADRPSFATIVGSGPNSTTLHYNADDRPIQAGETVVMDIGASYKGYAADVTRTIPSNGVYSPEQRDIYQVVRDAQAAAERAATLGAPASAMNDAAVEVLSTGLARLGLIESPTATYDCRFGDAVRKCPQYRLYYMHGLGHGIGLEVHDPDQYYFSRTIQPGSAFTIEPGIYVRANVLEVLPDTPANRALAERLRAAVQKYRNIGVRIEDDYLVTEKGVEWISRAPREMGEIEALMKAPGGARSAPVVP